MNALNYHHLQYFWAVAKEGNLTRTAKKLRVSQSALSTQIKRLEEQLGEPLFHRVGRRLELTEAGRIALVYAEDIFSAGTELVSTLTEGRAGDVLRIGAVATLSRNFQSSFVAPLLRQADVSLRLESGSLEELTSRLGDHTLDVVLSNRPVRRDDARPARCLRIARQEVHLIGRGRTAFRFPEDLVDARILLPGRDSEIRTAFDTLCAALGVQARALAEVDDMAMMRLVARDTGAVALLPSVVVRDELASGRLEDYGVVPGLYESFYATTLERRYPHPLLEALLARGAEDVLGP